MRLETRQKHAAKLLAAAGDGPLHIDEAIEALGASKSNGRGIVKALLIDGPPIPEITGYSPVLGRSKTVRRSKATKTETLTGSLEMPTRAKKKGKPGQFMQADDEPIMAWIWPVRNGRLEYGLFYRLR